MHTKPKRTIVTVSIGLLLIIGGSLYYAHQNAAGNAAGTNASSLPSTQAPALTHNTSPDTSPCPNDAPPVEVNIGGNPIQACSQPVDGTVTAISSSSITVKSSDTNQTQTFSIGSGVHITHHGAAIATSDIKVGDTVSLIPTNADATAAWYILVNPSFQGA